MKNMDNNTVHADLTAKKKGAKGSARETLYRTTLQNQMTSIAIVDQKANIIIGINTILISIIIALVGMETSFVQFDMYENIKISLPFSILLVFCVSSGIVSILVVRPTRSLWIKKNPSQLFFKNFKDSNLENFKKDMKKILKSNASIYEVLNTDIYLNGLTIQRKYRLVRYAYLLFMYGLLVAVFTFFMLQILISD